MIAHALFATLLCTGAFGEASNRIPEKQQTVSTFAPENRVLRRRVDEAIARLALVRIFAVRPVGFGLTVTQGQEDFEYLLRLPRQAALDAFDRLYATGNAQGEAYALLGMSRLDAKRFALLIAEKPKPTQPVLEASGCLITTKPMAQVIEGIQSGIYSTPQHAPAAASKP